MPVKKTADVVIVGGGIVGVSVAYFLGELKAGKVILFEKDLLGEGSTGKCAGGIRAQFSTEINIRFALESVKFYEEFKDRFGVDPEFHQYGYLFLITEERDWRAFQKVVELQRSFGIEVELLKEEEIRKRWPFLNTEDILGGTFHYRDGYAGPNEVVQALASHARRLGVQICQKTEVLDIDVSGGRVKSVTTTAGRVETPCVVNAAGPYASVVGRMAGVDIPVQPLRRQIYFTPPYGKLPMKLPMIIDFNSGWYFRREGELILMAGSVDDEPSYNMNTDFEGMLWAAERASHRVPILEEAGISSGWAGLYEISPDNHAILGRVPEVEGFIAANGFSGHGFQHGPVSGKVIAELIVYGEARTIDISPLSIERFKKGDLLVEPITAFQD